jgi:single-stranded-DNA-specific exonuclease
MRRWSPFIRHTFILTVEYTPLNPSGPCMKNSLTPVPKAIHLKPQREDRVSELMRQTGLGAVAARVLAARGFTGGDELAHFLNPTLKDGMPSPSLLKNLDAACELIDQTIRRGEAIGVCCDFDVDGLTGGAQVVDLLQVLGVRTHLFVPDRFSEGYGLNPSMIRAIKSAGCSLFIAIDFGTKNSEELRLARSLGVRSIVIDHHHVGDAEIECDVFINPHQAECRFAGGVMSASGLAWYLVAGLRAHLPQASHIDPRLYLDLACLGTICDMVPLTGVNRVIARRGLELLAHTPRVGLQALKQVSGLSGKVNCSDVSFGIGPRINAAGRMVHGEMVVKLFTTRDSREADRISHALNKLNTDRQVQEQAVRTMAIDQLRSRGSLGSGLVVWRPDFHTGVVGIVAQRLVEAFHRPAVVLGMGEDGTYRGSVRGIRGFSVVDALTSLGHYLVKYGGHDGAGGLSVTPDQVDAFAQAFDEECERRLAHYDHRPRIEADTEVSLADVTLDLVEDLQRFAPFGVGNPSPTLVARGLSVIDLTVVRNAHVKCVLGDDQGRRLPALLWRHTSHPHLRLGARVDVGFRAEKNRFQGVTTLQLNLQAIQPTYSGGIDLRSEAPSPAR